MRAALLLLLSSVAYAAPVSAPDEPSQMMELLESSRLDEARALVETDYAKPGIGPFLSGAYALYAGKYADAVRELDAALASGALEPRLSSDVQGLRTLAAATEQVTHGFVTKTSAHFAIATAPGPDELLAGPALDALERAWKEIGGDLGEQPPGPIRVEIYDAVQDLAKASPLTVTEIETSGTIALCKYDRLMATSPRALVAGYPWLDTLAHEFTHYLINRASRNAVPIWLHEGIAKTEERRWREPPSRTLPATAEHLLATGLRENHLITFSQMHPSMAKLPSQADAGLAYAEVETTIQLLTEKRGMVALRELIAALRDGADMNRAITIVTGQSFAAFEKTWRAWLKTRGFRQHPELGVAELRFRDQTKGKDDDDVTLTKSPATSAKEHEARGHVRLGTMLRTRGRLVAAAAEYERASALFGAGHPEVAARLGRTYLELKDWDRAIAAAKPGIPRRPDSAGLEVTVGRALLEKGDAAAATPYLEAALAVNPFDPQTRCGLSRAYKATGDARVGREADACSRLGGSP